MYFPTTRAHQEINGAKFVNIIIAEAHDPSIEHSFNGRVDLPKMQKMM